MCIIVNVIDLSGKEIFYGASVQSGVFQIESSGVLAI
jgi:hypothetical protein